MSLFTRLVGGYDRPPIGMRGRPHVHRAVARGYKLNDDGRPVCEICGCAPGRHNKAAHGQIDQQAFSMNVRYGRRPWEKPKREKGRISVPHPSRSSGILMVLVLIVVVLLFIH